MDFRNIISRNKSKLVKATNCNDALLDTLGEKEILHDSEVSDLKEEKSSYSRGSDLWNLLMKKSVTKEALIQIFKNHNQGAASLLSTLLPGNSLGGNASKTEDITKNLPNSATALAGHSNIALLSDEDLDFIKNKEPFKVQLVYPLNEINYSDDYYKLPREHKGYALVINITKFEDSSRNRSDAERDTVYLVNLFRLLGFTVDFTDVNDAFNEENIKEKVAKMKEKFREDTNAKCLAVFLGTHGIERKVLMSNGDLIDPYTEFAYKFIFNDLEVNDRKIAKLFFLNACDLTPSTSHSTMDNGVVRTKDIKDAMFSLSTSPGYPSIGDKFLGTHYVNLLTKIFMKHSHRYDLNTMLDLMEDFMRKLKKTDKEIQLPIHYGVSMKKLYFNLPRK